MINELTTIKSNDTHIKERISNILYKDFDRYLLQRIVHYYSVDHAKHNIHIHDHHLILQL